MIKGADTLSERRFGLSGAPDYRFYLKASGNHASGGAFDEALHIGPNGIMYYSDHVVWDGNAVKRINVTIDLINSGSSWTITSEYVLVFGLAWANINFIYFGYYGTGVFLLKGAGVNVDSSVSGSNHTIYNNGENAGLRVVGFKLR